VAAVVAVVPFAPVLEHLHYKDLRNWHMIIESPSIYNKSLTRNLRRNNIIIIVASFVELIDKMVLIVLSIPSTY
jgi:hypothetical protein